MLVREIQVLGPPIARDRLSGIGHVVGVILKDLPISRAKVLTISR